MKEQLNKVVDFVKASPRKVALIGAGIGITAAAVVLAIRHPELFTAAGDSEQLVETVVEGISQQ